MHISIFGVAPLIIVRLVDRLNENRDAFTHEEQLLILDSIVRVEEAVQAARAASGAARRSPRATDARRRGRRLALGGRFGYARHRPAGLARGRPACDASVIGRRSCGLPNHVALFALACDRLHSRNEGCLAGMGSAGRIGFHQSPLDGSRPCWSGQRPKRFLKEYRFYGHYGISEPRRFRGNAQ